jgi:hypothetical protein
MQLSLCTAQEQYGQFMKRLLKMGNLRNLSHLNKKKNRQWRDQLLLQWDQTEPAPTNAPSTGWMTVMYGRRGLSMSRPK